MSRGREHEADQSAGGGANRNLGMPPDDLSRVWRSDLSAVHQATHHRHAGGVIHLRLKVRVCQTPSCPRYHKAYRPEAEGRYVLP
jgi:hypothetical protein